MIRKFTQVQLSAGQTRRSFMKKAVPDCNTCSFRAYILSPDLILGDHSHFMKYAAKLAACLRHIIFADQVSCVRGAVHFGYLKHIGGGLRVRLHG